MADDSDSIDLGYERVTEYRARVVYRAHKGDDCARVLFDAVKTALGPGVVLTQEAKTAKLDTWLGWRDSPAPSLGRPEVDVPGSGPAGF